METILSLVTEYESGILVFIILYGVLFGARNLFLSIIAVLQRRKIHQNWLGKGLDNLWILAIVLVVINYFNK